MKPNKPKEKLEAYISSFLVCNSTKKILVDIANTKERHIQEIIRFSLNAMVKRWNSGITADEQLY